MGNSNVNRQFQAKTAKYDKMLSYRRETALHAALALAKSERLGLGDNTLRILYVYL